ncbi:MAG: DUF1810 domain-containing protein, partial [Chthoniobacterales bacterium]|nr:DUF1810 domain-containing protein [Chthoniobacterales bacterium]
MPELPHEFHKTHLDRFLIAQNNVFEHAFAEISNGRKTTHWMWFIFPQIHGLGSSEMSKKFAIRSLEEAKEFLNHPILGKRYLQCVEALLKHSHLPIENIFGHIDALKLRSSLTLFLQVASPQHSSLLQT